MSRGSSSGPPLDFEQAYDQQVSRVYGFFAYRLGSRPDAEDLTQQTFERALRAWDRYDPRRASVGTWMLAIARNLLVDHYRTAAARPSHLELDELSPQQHPSIDGSLPGLGLDPALADALSTLDDREREMLALRFGADLGGLEVAEIMGLSLANVHQISSRALRRLRAALET